jgi:hypothetical protein
MRPNELRAADRDDLLQGLLKVQPHAVLDELFSGSDKDQRGVIRAIESMTRSRKNPLDAVSDEEVLSWCNEQPKTRFRLIAQVCRLFGAAKESEPEQWQPLAAKLIHQAPDGVSIVEIVGRRVRPSSWTGSLARSLESRLRPS